MGRRLSVSFSIALASTVSAFACSLFDPILDATKGAQSSMSAVASESGAGDAPASQATPPDLDAIASDATALDATTPPADDPDTWCPNPTVYAFDFSTYPPPGFVENNIGDASFTHVVDDGYETEAGAVVATLTPTQGEPSGASLARFFDAPGNRFKLTYAVKLEPAPPGMRVYPGCFAGAAAQSIVLIQENNGIYVIGGLGDGGFNAHAADITETKWHSVTIRAGIPSPSTGYLFADFDGVPVTDLPPFGPVPGSTDSGLNGVNVGCGGNASGVNGTTTIGIDDVRLEICP